MTLSTSSGLGPAVLVTGGAGFIGCALAPHLLERGLPVVAVDNLLAQVHPGQARPAALPDEVELRRRRRRRPRGVGRPALPGAPRGRGPPRRRDRHGAVADRVHPARDHQRGRHDRDARRLRPPRRAAGARGAHLEPRGLRRGAVAGGRRHGLRAGAALPRPARRGAVGARRRRRAGRRPAWRPRRRPPTPTRPASTARRSWRRSWCSATGRPASRSRSRSSGCRTSTDPGQSPHNPYTGIITLFHRLASRGETLDVYEDGEINRDFVYIDDVVSALARGIDAPPAGQRILDVGNGVMTTIHDAARMIAAHHGAPEPQVSGQVPRRRRALGVGRHHRHRPRSSAGRPSGPSRPAARRCPTG